MKVFIDAGHGGFDSGAVKGNRREKYDTLRLSIRIGEILRSRGVSVNFTRTTDDSLANNTNDDLNARCKKANDWDADYFISIHRNSAGETATGAENWIHSKATPATVNFGQHILNAVIDATGYRNRGLKKGYLGNPNVDFAVNRLTNMTSCLLELGFISNDDDNRIFDEKFEAMAEAIANALCDIGGINKNNSQPQPNNKKILVLPSTATQWRVYPLNVAPVVGNECGLLYPSKFGGLEYEILDTPQPNVATIQTRDYGKVNIWIASDTGAVVK